MKTIASLIALSLTLGSLSAAPSLLLETEVQSAGTLVVLSKLEVESGKCGVLRSGTLEVALTPTLRPDGTVEMSAAVTDGADSEKASTLQTKLHLKLGKTAEFKSGGMACRIQASLAQ